jgi:adenosine deaminase
VNADDPLLVGSTLLGEHELCRREFGFDDDRMAAIARPSIEAGSAPASVKEAALADIDKWLNPS